MSGRLFDKNGEELTVEAAGRLLSDRSYVVVEHSSVNAGNQIVDISTVWLGVDHNFYEDGPPLIFETMVFDGEYDGYQERYHTEDEARKRHFEIARAIARGEDPYDSQED